MVKDLQNSGEQPKMRYTPFGLDISYGALGSTLAGQSGMTVWL
jgi:hypothetical protein